MADEKSDADKLVGVLLSQTYRLEQVLAQGGMGAVYRARHVRTGGSFAVKILHEKAAQTGDLFERFQDEARIISSLRHQNIVQVVDLDKDERDITFIVMELLEGEDLQDRLERETQLSLPAALKITRELSMALQSAHQRGVVHRDLKPRNIFLNRQELAGEIQEQVKIIDFGVSKIARPADRATKDLMVLGTPRYLPPEGATGQNSQIDGRSDQWSVAVILYRLLSGKLPFDSDSVVDLFRQVVNDDPPAIESLVPGLPPHIGQAIRRALSKKKEQRFANMIDFITALESPIAGTERLAVLPPKQASALAPAPVRPSKLRSLGFGLAGAGLMAGILLPPLWLVQSRKRDAAQAAESLQQAEQALLDDRIEEAAQLVQQAQVLGKRQSEGFARTLQAVQQRVQTGQKAQEVQQKLTQALLEKDYDRAVVLNSELPPTAKTRMSAQQQHAILLPLLIGNHIQKAEAARTMGRCAEVQDHVAQILRADPGNEAALQARWRPCVNLEGAPMLAVSPLAGYPPVRDRVGTQIEMAGDHPGGKTTLQDVDRFLREAQIAQEEGRLWRALTLANAAASTKLRAPTAWRLIGVVSCQLHLTKLSARASEHLDPTSRDLVKAMCLRTQAAARPKP